MTRVLVTGFGSFPGAPKNPTVELVAWLARSRRLATEGLRIASHVFPTRYDAVDASLATLIAQTKPDVLIMFGVAVRARKIRIELLARNRISVLFPDAGGVRPASPTIALGAPACKRGRFNLPRALAAVRMSGPTPAIVSRNAGRYLCNYAYWRALDCAARPDGPKIVMFVHVPPIRTTSRRKRSDRQRLTLDALARAAEAVVLTMR